jgi:hypothetical protein
MRNKIIATLVGAFALFAIAGTASADECAPGYTNAGYYGGYGYVRPAPVVVAPPVPVYVGPRRYYRPVVRYWGPRWYGRWGGRRW